MEKISLKEHHVYKWVCRNCNIENEIHHDKLEEILTEEMLKGNVNPRIFCPKCLKIHEVEIIY